MKKFTISLLTLALGPVVYGQTLSATGTVNQARWNHQAQTLANGKVLTFGGSDAMAPNPSTYYNTSELYNPSTGTWSMAGSMNSKRERFASVLLANGNVLAIGGKTSDAITTTASCEIYNASNDTWSYTDSMAYPRYEHDAVMLQDGRVLVAGGFLGAGNTAELYDPGTGTWSAAANMNYTYGKGFEMAVLQDGRVLACGGDAIPAGNVAEMYDPVANTWTILPTMNEERSGHEMVVMNDGRVLIFGGDPAFSSTTEIYDPVANTFTYTGDTDYDHGYCPGRLLTDGRVLTFGIGNLFSPGDTKVIEVYDPATGTWSSPPSSGYGSGVYAMARLQTGQILIISGNVQTGGGAQNFCWLIGGVSAVGVSELASDNSAIYVYPNPVDDFLNLEVDTDGTTGTLNVELVSITGEKVISETLPSGTIAVDVSKLEAGTYFVNVFDGVKRLKTEKVMIR